MTSNTNCAFKKCFDHLHHTDEILSLSFSNNPVNNTARFNLAKYNWAYSFSFGLFFTQVVNNNNDNGNGNDDNKLWRCEAILALRFQRNYNSWH